MAKRKTFKVGDKFRVKTTYSGYVPGTIYVVNGINGAQACGATEEGVNIGQWIAFTNMDHAERNKKDLEAQKANLMTKLDDVNAKLAYLEEYNLTEYDENEFKIHQALTVLDETTDKRERTKKLAALLKDLS